jgi:hypothetical protein
MGQQNFELFNSKFYLNTLPGKVYNLAEYGSKILLQQPVT